MTGYLADSDLADSPLTLISHPLCPYVQRAAITLSEKGVAFRRVDIDLSAKPDWFLALSPLGRTPVLAVTGPAGREAIFESQVICEYLEETTPDALHPEAPLARARHRSWIEFASETLAAIARLYSAAEERSFDEARRQLTEKLGRVEGELGDGPFFDGARFRMVDAAWAPVFRYFPTLGRCGAGDPLESLPRMRAWSEALLARPSVARAVGPDYAERLEAFLRRRDSVIGAAARAAAL